LRNKENITIKVIEKNHSKLLKWVYQKHLESQVQIVNKAPYKNQ
jgi:hypothetical protein